MKFLRNIFIPALLFAEIFSSCHPNSKHTPSLSAADSLLIQQWKSLAIPLFASNTDSFAALQLLAAEKFQGANQLGNWLNCYDTIILAFRKQEQFDKMLATYAALYENMWREPSDSFSLVTLAESNRQLGRYYYHDQNDYSHALHFYDQGIRLMEQANAWTPDAARLFYKAAGNCASRMDDYEKSIVYQEHYTQVCRDFKDTVNLWQALNDMSYPYMETGKYKEAEALLREGLRLVQHSDSTEQLIDLCMTMADLFTRENKLD